MIAGEDGEPLIAKGHLDSGDDIAGQDLLVGLLSGVGRMGEVFAQPRVRSRSSISSGGFSLDTISTESREPQIWSAVLDGFFGPLANGSCNNTTINQNTILFDFSRKSNLKLVN